MTEFKWYEGLAVHKVYLSAILDLCDRRIVAYAISERNDNPLFYKAFDRAVADNPGKQFNSKQSLLQTIEGYIRHYNNRHQRNLGVLAPVEKYTLAMAA